MKTFYGTKKVMAGAMSRLEYNTYRGWTVPDDGNGNDAGYLVEYLDGGQPNHPDHTGYISWSPKEQFDAAYQETDCMNFGHALIVLKAGGRVARNGWNGKHMFVEMKHGNNDGPSQRYFVINHPTGVRDAWFPSVSDCLAEDWGIVWPQYPKI